MNKLAVIPKNKTGGIVTGTIFAIGGLIIATILILIIVSTINGAKLIGNDQVNTFTITNESVTFDAVNTVQNLVARNYKYATCGIITYIANQTTTGQSLTIGNVTQSGCTVINATALNDAIGNGTVYISYPWTKTETQSKDAVANMTANFTAGLDNVSNKIPTILLIIAVVFLFGALVLLVREAQNMGIGGGGGSL